MRAHIVLAHPEPQSYNAHLAHTARSTLSSLGWSVTVSDLHALDFDPCDRPAHYPARSAPQRFDVQSEQRHASAAGTLAPQVASEIAQLDAADLLILQYPMWWHLPPAILKGWFDRVFAHGAVYTSTQRFERGRFVGKRALLSVTLGTSAETYAHDGRSGDIDLLLWPVHFSLAYVGYEVLAPVATYGVEAGLRYSDPDVVTARLAKATAAYAEALVSIESRPTIPFNRMAEWGADGRIVPGAPVHSPFIRRRQKLELD
jgi:NAD(P)H dehydrogenase (quinone)